MSSSKVIYSLTSQESILYFYIKQHGWTLQRTLVIYRGKDDRATRKYLLSMESKGFLKSKYVISNDKKYPRPQKYYNLKH